MIDLFTKENSTVTLEQVTASIDHLVNARNQGYLNLHMQEKLWKSSMELAQSFRRRPRQFVLCVIGGSSLGFESFQHFF